MDLYDAIFYRRTIKEYSNRAVKPELMKEIKEICKNIDYLNEELDIKAHLIDRGHLIQFLMKKDCNIKAPHYILVTSDKGEDYLQNIGFAIENVVLQLTTLGLGTCWIECNLSQTDVKEIIDIDTESIEIYSKEQVKEEEDIDLEESIEECEEQPYIVIAFGYPKEGEHIFRNINAEPRRKRIKEISKKMDRKWTKILSAARMSASIKNVQPWRFYNAKTSIDIYEEKQKKSIERMSKVSMGICLRNFDIACKKYDIKVRYEKTKAKKRLGKEYYISAIIEE